MAEPVFDPLVLLVGFVMTLTLLIGLIVYFIKSGYFRYKDLRLMLNSFVALTGVVVLTAASYTNLLAHVRLNPIFEILTHLLSATAAWILAADAYRAFKVMTK